MAIVYMVGHTGLLAFIEHQFGTFVGFTRPQKAGFIREQVKRSFQNGVLH